MRMYIKLLSTVCLCALVSACSKKEEPSAQEQIPFTFETQTETQTQGAPETSEFARFDGNLNENNFKVTVTPAEFGKYVLSLKWDKTIETMQVRVSNGPTMTKRNLYEHTQKVEAGKSLKIHFAVLNGNNETVSVMDVDIETPFDFLVKEPLHLKEDTEWHLGRLHILPGGQIMTNGARLTIHADEIHHHQPEFTSVNMDMAKHSVVNLENKDDFSGMYGGHSRITILTKKLLGGFSIFTQTTQVIYNNNKPNANWPQIIVEAEDINSGCISIVRLLIHKEESISSWSDITTNLEKQFRLDRHQRSSQWQK
ncbi:hypothetical protein BDW_13380 [Bdellovibrio bacteriovorus W]|nr:hypothetical protein BDW_13380 [Bdellovibrio bacteriovorus W]